MLYLISMNIVVRIPTNLDSFFNKSQALMNHRISALQNLTFSTICNPKIQEKQKTPVTL